MNQEDKNKIQAELERLSWKFIAEISENKQAKDEAEMFLDEDMKSSEDDKFEGITATHGKLREDSFSGFVENSFGANDKLDLGEDTLEEYKIDAWHIPAAVNNVWYKKLLKAVSFLFLAPFKLFAWLVRSGINGGVYILSKLLLLVRFLLRVFLKLTGCLGFGLQSIFKRLKFKLDSSAEQTKFKHYPVAFTAKPLKGALFFVFLLALIIIPFGGYVAYYYAQQIKGEVMGAADIGWSYLKQASNDSQEFDFDGAAEHFKLARENFEAIEKRVNFLGAVSSGLTEIVPETKQAKKVMRSAELFARAGERLSGVMQLLFASQVKIALDNTATLNSSQTTEADWQRISAEMKTAVQEATEAADILIKVDLNKLPLSAEQKRQIKQVKISLPGLIARLKEGENIVEVVNYLAGRKENRRLMLVFENNNELRPGGGFMGSYAIVDIKDGKIKKINVPGGGFYDLKGSLTVKIDAPYPFHLFSSIWQPWNANWFYDWPTSAQKIEWFYDKSGGSTVDGVIAFTPDVVEDLLSVTGPIEMPKYGVTVRADNFVKVTQRQVELEYDKQENRPKKFIGDLLPKLLERLAKLDKKNMAKLWQIAQGNLTSKNLLVYVNDNLIQEKVVKLGWAGQVKTNRYDYLAVVHTNVAGGKTDGVIKQSLDYQVNILDDGRPEVELTLTKEHLGNPQDVFEGQTNVDYIRFYVPYGSRLISAEGFDEMPHDRVFQTAEDTVPDPWLLKVQQSLRVDPVSKTRIANEFGKTVFANWVIVRVGEKKQVKLKYILPFSYKQQLSDYSSLKLNWWQKIKNYFHPYRLEKVIRPQVYSLLIQKQPGVKESTVNFNFNLNSDYKLKEVYPQIKGNFNRRAVKYNFNLKSDAYLRFVFE